LRLQCSLAAISAIYTCGTEPVARFVAVVLADTLIGWLCTGAVVFNDQRILWAGDTEEGDCKIKSVFEEEKANHPIVIYQAKFPPPKNKKYFSIQIQVKKQCENCQWKNKTLTSFPSCVLARHTGGICICPSKPNTSDAFTTLPIQAD
jgi:hypothetical protein